MSRDELRRAIANATGLGVELFKIWVTAPGCVEVRMPADTTCQVLGLVEDAALMMFPCWVYVTTVRDDEWVI